MKSSLLGLAVSIVWGLTTSTAFAGGEANPFLPQTGQAYRHGAVPTRETTARIHAWENSHAAPFAAPTASTGKLSYGGGVGGVGVLSGQSKVYLVFYGTQWGTQSGPDAY